MSNNKATPRPWLVAVFSETEFEVRAGGYLVARCFSDPVSTPEANAALIVEAVNSHDALKEQNAELAMRLDRAVWMLDQVVPEDEQRSALVQKTIDESRAALAKAGGQS